MGDSPSCPVCGAIMTQEWKLLPVHELRQHQRMLVKREIGEVNLHSRFCKVRSPDTNLDT